MKKVLVAVLAVVFAATLASAELMTTSDPVGKGNWAFLGSGIQDQNFSNDSDASLTTIGGVVGYGITDQLDAYVQLGSSTSNNLPTDVTGTGYGVNFKYTVWEESHEMPVTVSTGLGYKSTTWKASGISDQNATQLSLGAGISKVWQQFIPYGGLAYRKNSQDGSDLSSQIDLTVGSSIPWPNMGAFFVEYTLQSITPDGGSNYSSNQIGAGFGTKL